MGRGKGGFCARAERSYKLRHKNTLFSLHPHLLLFLPLLIQRKLFVAIVPLCLVKRACHCWVCAAQVGEVTPLAMLLEVG